MKHYPDTWCILHRRNAETNEDIIKVFAGFYGGYASGDSWRLSSGTMSINEIAPAKEGTAYKNSKGYEFKQYSGCSYIISNFENPPSGWVGSVLSNILEQVKDFKIISIEEAIAILEKEENENC